MKRTDADGHSNNQFQDGDEGQGIQGTVVDASFLNNVQEELASVVEAAGIVLDGGDTKQVIKSLSKVLGFSAVVGSAAQVTAGVATHSTAQAAHDAIAAGDRVLLLPGTWGALTITKKSYWRGLGHGSEIGALTVNADACALENLRINGNIGAGTGKNLMISGWQVNGGTDTHAGAGYLRNILEEEL